MHRSKSASSFKLKNYGSDKGTTTTKRPSNIKSNASASGAVHTPKITYTKKNNKIDLNPSKNPLVSQSLNMNSTSMKEY